jgi:hypothetical protein
MSHVTSRNQTQLSPCSSSQKEKKEKRKKQKFQKSKRGKEKGTYIVEFKRRKIELCGQQILPMMGNSNFILMFYYHCI